MEVVGEVMLIDSSLLRQAGTGQGLGLGHCLVDGPGLDTDLDGVDGVGTLNCATNPNYPNTEPRMSRI